MTVRLFALCFILIPAAVHADDWPQWLGPQRDGVWRETGILDKFPSGGPKQIWEAKVGGGYAGPAVAGGKVYVTDRILKEGAKNPSNPFAKDSVPGRERVLCLDEATGKVIWQHDYDCGYRISYASGPRCTPLVAGGKVYTLGAMGDLICFDAVTGKVIWQKNFPKDYGAEPPIWGFAAHPLLDGDHLISLVGGDGSAAVAFHKDTGVEVWKALSAKDPGYCPPMAYTFAGKKQIIIWHPTAISGVMPETGKVLWTQAVTSRAGMSIPTPRQQGDRLFATSFYNGGIMLDLASGEPRVMWKSKSKNERPDGTDGLHSVMSTPFWVGGHIYGVCSHGEMRCLNAATGERVWESLVATSSKKRLREDRWNHLFLTENAGRYFLFTEHGELLIAKLSPEGYEEIDRATIIKPTNPMAGRPTVWMHPAYANGRIYARNDEKIICVDLKK